MIWRTHDVYTLVEHLAKALQLTVPRIPADSISEINPQEMSSVGRVDFEPSFDEPVRHVYRGIRQTSLVFRDEPGCKGIFQLSGLGGVDGVACGFDRG